MSATTLTITKVSEADLPRLASIEISSRAANPLDQAKFPLESQLSQREKQEAVLRRMRFEYSRSTSIYMKATSASSEEITGYVKWDSPSSSLPAPPAHTLINPISGSEYMIGADRALFQSMSTEHNKALDSVAAGREHWYLSVIVVDPEHQGTGVGSALLKWGTKRADEDGVGVFCLSSAEGWELYSRRGFEERLWCDFVTEKGEVIRERALWREPVR